jgi:hypothetical protein
MGQRWAAFLLAALLILGLCGCGSTDNRAMDGSRYRTYGEGDSRYRNGDDVLDGLGDGLDHATDEADDVLNGRDGSRYREMLRNGYVHDTDGYLLDGENSRS